MKGTGFDPLILHLFFGIGTDFTKMNGINTVHQKVALLVFIAIIKLIIKVVVEKKCFLFIQ